MLYGNQDAPVCRGNATAGRDRGTGSTALQESQPLSPFPGRRGEPEHLQCTAVSHWGFGSIAALFHSRDFCSLSSFGQHFRHILELLGVPCAGPGVEHDDPCGSLPAQGIPWQRRTFVKNIFFNLFGVVCEKHTMGTGDGDVFKLQGLEHSCCLLPRALVQVQVITWG